MHHTDPEYLEILQDYHALHGVLPSYAVVKKLTGHRTTSGVTALARRLREAGYLSRGAGGRLAPGERFFERKSVATLAPAGGPSPVLPDVVDPFEIDRFLVLKPSKTVIWEIKGDSMINAGLLSGDRAVVQLEEPGCPGDIVMALVDHEVTVKTLARDGDRLFLMPANANFSDIYPKFQLQVIGVVVGSFRRFK